MSTIGTRGKVAEGIFRKWAKERSDARAGFAFHRFPDPRAGSLQAVPSDFEVLDGGTHYNIEIKEVDHKHLLPKKNFSKDKIARMRKWVLAGSEALVMVYFPPLELWRVTDVDWFFHRMNDKGAWDMSGFPLMKFNEAVTMIFGE